MRMRTGKTYKSNSARATARGLRQIAAGQVKTENGLIATPMIVISEPVVELLPVSKPKRKSAPRKIKALTDGSTLSV